MKKREKAKEEEELRNINDETEMTMMIKKKEQKKEYMRTRFVNCYSENIHASMHIAIDKHTKFCNLPNGHSKVEI